MAEESGCPPSSEEPCTSASPSSIPDCTHLESNSNREEHMSRLLLQKIKELEEGQNKLKEELSRLTQVRDPPLQQGNQLVASSSASHCTCCHCGHSSSMEPAPHQSHGGGEIYH
eukprot:c36667_g1_i1 orf=3-341(-)